MAKCWNQDLNPNEPALRAGEDLTPESCGLERRWGGWEPQVEVVCVAGTQARNHVLEKSLMRSSQASDNQRKFEMGTACGAKMRK